ncbi:MAG: hypothetical protein ACRD8W_32545 [Nitrososphaeraceae archaeon]
MNVKYVTILAIVLVLSSGIPLMSGSSINYASAKYATNTQTMMNSNECDNGANCANPTSQSIGGGTANAPVNTQISNFNELQEGVGEEPNPGARGFVEVTKTVICPTGFQCPRPGPTSPYKMKVDVSGDVSGAGWNPMTFDGCCDTPTGITQVIINLTPDGTANYIVTETDAPTIPGLTLVKVPSTGCQGTIRQTERKICNFVNEYKNPLDSRAEILVKQLVICPQGFVCPPPERFSNRVTVFGQVTVTPNGVIPGSEAGTKFVIDFDAGTTSVSYTYTIDQRRPAPLPDGLTLVTTRSGCEGTISPKDQRTCIFTNEYRVR